MKKILAALLLAAALPATARDLVIAVGAAGDPVYAPIFRKEADAWAAAGKKAGFSVATIGLDDKKTPRVELEKILDALPKTGDDLWLVLIGHGTFDGRSAKFNLRDDDVSSTELAGWLDPFRRRVVVWNLFSASGAFLPDLSRANRIIIAATRSGGERNYSRFGEKLAEILSSPDADLDGDGTVSLVELVAGATARTVSSYENDQRLLSEHAVLDDNGDGAGTESALLLHPAPDPTRTPDGAVAATASLSRDDSTPALNNSQILRRADIEKRIATLRAQKTEMDETAYYEQLESLMLEMARLYQSARGPGR